MILSLHTETLPGPRVNLSRDRQDPVSLLLNASPFWLVEAVRDRPDLKVEIIDGGEDVNASSNNELSLSMSLSVQELKGLSGV